MIDSFTAGQLSEIAKTAGLFSALLSRTEKLEETPKIDKLKDDVELNEYQKDFLNKLRKNNGVAIAAHEVGSGKTLSSIAGFLERQQEGKATKALVLVPAALKTNYAENIDRFSTAKHQILESPRAQKGKDFYILSKDKFIKDPEKYMKTTGADAIIVDELHRAKDPSTEFAKSLAKVRPEVGTLIGLTGTPFNNRPEEFFQLLGLVSGQRMTPSEMNRFISRAPTGIAEWLHLKRRTGAPTGFKNTSELRSRASPFVHIVDTPPGLAPRRKEITKSVDMSEEETAAYKKVLEKELTARERGLLRNKNSDFVERQQIINKAMGARQQSNNSGYLFNQNVPSTKVIQAVDDLETHLAERPDNHVIVFSSFIDSGIAPLEKELDSRNIPYAKYLGTENTSEKERQKAVEEFRSGGKRVILVSGAGGEGLSLPDTSMVQMLDGHYNPSALTQREGRGIRVGGLSGRPPEEREVKVIRYKAMPSEGDVVSLDQAMYDIAERKAALNRELKKILQ